jgi:hypothetical protein
MARRSGLLAFSQESHHVQDPRASLDLSMEEMGVLIDDAAEDAATIDNDLDQADKIIEIAQNLESMTDAAAAKGELTDGEAAMMESAGDMAVAGTDAAPESVVPAMEAYRENGKIMFGTLAMEDFKGIVRNAWEAVKRLIKRIWKYIADFFYKIVGTIPTYRRRLHGLRERAREISGKNREEAKFTISNSQSLHVGKGPAKTYETFFAGLKATATVAECVFKEDVPGLKSVGTTLADAFSEFSIDNPQAAASKFAKKAEPLTKASKGRGITGDKRWKDHIATGSDDLLGGKVLVHAVPKEVNEHEGNDLLNTLAKIRRTTFTLEQAHDGATDSSGSVDFQTLSAAEAEKVIDEALKILDLVEDFERSKLKRELSETQSKIEKAADKAEGAVSKIRGGNDNEAERTAVPYYRGLIDMAAWYARCVSSPAVPLARLAIKNVQTAITIVDRSFAQYK